MELHVVVSTALERDGKFLLIQRSPSSTLTGLWEFPAGGVELGEKLATAALRETSEETGILPKKLDYCGYSERFDDRHVIVHHFRAPAPLGTPVLRPDEHADWKWSTKDEILRMELIGTETTPEERERGNFEGKVSVDTVRFFRF